jgi:hypothetical protein
MGDSSEHPENDMTNKIQFEAIKWPENMAPSRCPIHFANEREVTTSPETVWSLLVDPRAWASFYPGVGSGPMGFIATYNSENGERRVGAAKLKAYRQEQV